MGARGNFALFLSTQGGRSLSGWERYGMLEREIKPYAALAHSFDNIYLFTYGPRSDRAYQSMLPKNVMVMTKPAWIPTMVYSFLMPFFYGKILRTVHIMKTNQMDGSWTAVIAKKLYGGKLVVRCGYEWLETIERSGRGLLKRWFASWAERAAYRHADAIIMASRSSISFAQARFNVPSGKITLIPNYVDTDRFIGSAAPKEKGSVIFIGRLEAEKNIPLIIDALQGLQASLTIVGSGSMRSELERRAKEKHVAVAFLGTVPQPAVAAALAKSEVLVLMSKYEGNPKALLEAMACGLACIGSNIPGITDIITDGKDGIICESNAAALHHALQKLLSDDALRDSLGVQARATILDRYSFERILEAELSVYTRLA